MALAPLAPLAIVFTLIAIALTIYYIMNTIGDVLKGIPIAGGYLASAAKSIAQACSHAAGYLENQVDHIVGGAWHLMARYFDRTWHQLEAQAHLAWVETARLGDLAYSHLGLKAAVHSIAATARAAWHDVKRLERWSLRIEARIKSLEHALGHGIGEDVLPRIKTLEREYAHIEHKELKAIRAEAAAAEADVTALQKWITANVPLASTATFAGVVAFALASLGLGGLRCSNFTKLLSKWGCGLGSLLDDALSLLVAALALESVCEFLPLIEDAFGAIIGPMVHLLNEVPLGTCEKVPKGWAQLDVAAGPLPPAQTLGTYPS